MLDKKVVKFQLAQKIYLLVTTITLGLLFLFLIILGFTKLDWLVDLPFDIYWVFYILMWGNLIHFIYGIYQLIYYHTVIKKTQVVSLVKTIVSILLSPVLFIVIYFLLFLTAIVSCARNT